jgi:hypothetical protein
VACVHQSPAALERPAGLLRVADLLCETLVGYGIAEPWVPPARSALGFKTAFRALLFLRGVARSAHVTRALVDCRAVGQFYRFFRGLGADADQALALRGSLLRNRSSIAPTLSLTAGCPIH